MIGLDDGELFDATSAELVRAHDRMVMSTRLAETTEEIITAADTTRTFLATKAPYFDDQGDVIGVIGVSRDISARNTKRRCAKVSLVSNWPSRRPRWACGASTCAPARSSGRARSFC